MNNIIGAIVIAAVVGGVLAYNGHQDRLQRQCIAALASLRMGFPDGVGVRYSVETMTGVYCAGWGKQR